MNKHALPRHADSLSPKPPPCTAFELLSIAKEMEPREPQKAFKRALAQLTEAQSYLEDPSEIDDRYLSFGDRLRTRLLTFIVHLPLPGQESQDQFRRLAEQYDVKLPAKRETLLRYCREWWKIEVEPWIVVQQQTGKPADYERKWDGDGSRPERLMPDYGLRLLLYCLRRHHHSQREAKASYYAWASRVEEVFEVRQKSPKKSNSVLDGTSRGSARRVTRRRSSRTAGD